MLMKITLKALGWLLVAGTLCVLPAGCGDDSASRARTPTGESSPPPAEAVRMFHNCQAGSKRRELVFDRLKFRSAKAGSTTREITEVINNFERHIEVIEVSEDGTVQRARIKYDKADMRVSRNVSPDTDEMGKFRSGVSFLSVAELNYSISDGALKCQVSDQHMKYVQVKAEVARGEPFLNPIVPDRDVKIGDTWVVDGQRLARFLSQRDLRGTSADGSATAVEIQESIDGRRLLEVTFKGKFAGEWTPEAGSATQFNGELTGVLRWDIEASRVYVMDYTDTMSLKYMFEGAEVEVTREHQVSTRFRYE